MAREPHTFGPLVECACSGCGVPFTRRLCWVRGDNFCTRKCKATTYGKTKVRKPQPWNSGSVSLTCSNCQTPIKRRPGAVRKKNWCSKECQNAECRGQNNPRYTGGRMSDEVCPTCGAAFKRYRTKASEGIAQYCSRQCAGRSCIVTPEHKREMRRQRSRRRHARRRAAEKLSGCHTEAEWQDVLNRHGRKCARCGNEKNITRDHIIPLSKSGTDEIANIQPLCGHCNKKKKDFVRPIPMRVLSIDVGLRAGYAIVERGKAPKSGSHKFRNTRDDLGKLTNEFSAWCHDLIRKNRPDIVVYALPFIGRFATPASLEVIFGFSVLLELVADKRNIRCYGVNESQARRAFLTKVPKKSADIKTAMMAACLQRGWRCPDHHAADALCVASSELDKLEPDTSHEATPLFQPKRRRKPQ